MEYWEKDRKTEAEERKEEKETLKGNFLDPEDYDEPQPWFDEFEYIEWCIAHR